MLPKFKRFHQFRYFKACAQKLISKIYRDKATKFTCSSTKSLQHIYSCSCWKFIIKIFVQDETNKIKNKLKLTLLCNETLSSCISVVPKLETCWTVMTTSPNCMTSPLLCCICVKESLLWIKILALIKFKWKIRKKIIKQNFFNGSNMLEKSKIKKHLH